MSLETNIKEIVDKGNYSELEKEFIMFYWESIRKDHLSTINNNNIWIPHIGLFRLKYNSLVNKAKKLLLVMKKFKSISEKGVFKIPEEKSEAVKQEFRLIWKHIQAYKQQFYKERNPE